MVTVWALTFEQYWVFTWFCHWSRYESERIPRIKEILEKTKESEESDDKTRLLYLPKFPALKVSQ
jgi:hypothetical protein